MSEILSTVTIPPLLDETGLEMAEALETIAQAQAGTLGVLSTRDTTGQDDAQAIAETGGYKTKPQMLDRTGKRIASALSAIATIQSSNVRPEGFVGAQSVIRQGLGERLYPVGEQLVAHHETYGDILLDVVVHNRYLDPTGEHPYSMMLVSHDCIYGIPMTGQQMLWANTTDAELPAGAYTFTLYKGSNGGNTYEDGTYRFETTKPIPVGGGFIHPNLGVWYPNPEQYTPENITGYPITTYDADRNVLETGLVVTASTDGTNLGTASNSYVDCIHTIGRFNGTSRPRHGNNNISESSFRLWANSSAGANEWWKRQTLFDLPPANVGDPGFLAGFDEDFLSAIGEVEIVTACNLNYENDGNMGGSYTMRDKIFLPSMAEVSLGDNNGIMEGRTLNYYIDAGETDRIKYDQASNTVPRLWWLRSPYVWGADSLRVISEYGQLTASVATSGIGMAFACVIY